MARNRKSGERAMQHSRMKAGDESSRELLLQATRELLIERGANNVSFKDIGERSGVNAALIGYYFKSKSGLMLDVLRNGLALGMSRMVLIPDLDFSPQDKLRCFVEIVVDVFSTYPYINQLMRWLIAQKPEVYGPLIATDLAQSSGRAVDRVLAEGIAKGVFRPVDPMLFYVQLTGACDQLFYGWHQLQLVYGVDKITDDVKSTFVRNLLETLLNGLMLDHTRDEECQRIGD